MIIKYRPGNGFRIRHNLTIYFWTQTTQIQKAQILILHIHVMNFTPTDKKKLSFLLLDPTMIDIQTYRARIGGAPGMMSKILQRKLNNFILQESMTHHHDDEELLKKTLKNIKVSQLHYVFFLLLTVAVAVMRSLALQNKFSTPDLKYIASVFCDGLTDNLSETFETIIVLLNVLSKQIVQYMWEWTPIYEGADAFLSEGTLTVFCTAVCLHSIGAVHFIAILLLIAGIEPNPGPNSPKGSRKTDDEPKNNEEPHVASSDTSPNAQFSKLSEPSPSTISEEESVFTNETQGEVKLSLKGRDIRDKEEYEKLIDDIDQSSDQVCEIDLSLSTYCSSPWSEHPDGETSLKRLLTHPKLQFVRKVSLDVGEFSAQSRGGLSVNLEQKLLTKTDFKMLTHFLNYVMSAFEINTVNIHSATIDSVPWGEHEEGLALLNDFLIHPRLHAASNVRIYNIGLTSIPKALAKFSQPRITLNISNNKIDTIDQLFGSKRIVDLDLSGNRLITLPETLDLPNLETLNLEWNPFYEIPAVLNQLRKLTTVTIGSPETRTINRMLLDHVYVGKINIHIRNCREELRAPTVEQLESKRELKAYMDQYDKKCQHKHKQLIGMSSRNLTI